MKNTQIAYVENFLIDKESKQIYFIGLDDAFEYPEECENFFVKLKENGNYLLGDSLVDDPLYADMLELFEDLGVLRNTPPPIMKPTNPRVINVISYMIYFIIFLGISFSIIMYPTISEVSLFSNHVLLSFVLLFVFAILLNLLHELGHYLYVRKVLHLPAKIGVNHRAYIFLVFECTMNGITVLPKKQKNSALLAGIAVDSFIIVLSSLLFMRYKSQFLLMILFIQITKGILHFLIAFKTDIYYLIKFNFKNINMDLLKKLSYILIIFVIYVYIRQIYYLFNNIELNVINVSIIVFIMSISVIIAFFKKNEEA